MTLRKPVLVIPFILMMFSPLRAQGQTHQWSQRFGDASEQRGRSVAADGSGNVIVVGPFGGTVDFGGGTLSSAGGSDIYVAKFDPSGSHVWSQRFGNATFDQSARNVAVDAAGNVIVTGATAGTVDFGGGPLTSAGGDTFVAKYDPNGSHLWSQLFGDNAGPWGLAVDVSGNVAVVGLFAGQVDFGGGVLTSAGGVDIYVAKFDPNGGHLWSHRFGDADDEYPRGVATDPSGNVVVVGSFAGQVDFGGGVLTSAGGLDTYVAKFDSNGNHVWSQRFGDAQRQSGWAVATDASENVIIANRFWGTVDFGGGPLVSAGESDIYVAKFDANGNHVWSQRFGDENDFQAGWGLTTDASGNVIVSGSLSGNVDFGGELLSGRGFAVKLDPSGNHLWSLAFGNDDTRGGYVSADPLGNVILAGAFKGTVDFGGGPLTSAGDYDVYLAKFVASTVATALQGFHSYWIENHVELSWRLVHTSGELSFEVWRAKDPSETFQRIHNAGVYRRGDEFIFEDHATEPGLTYTYRVVIYEAGEAVTSFETELSTPSTAFALRQNHPNPFNPHTTLRFEIPKMGHVTLRVYDATGRLMATLVDEERSAGKHQVSWSGKDSSGKAVSSGVYIARLQASEHSSAIRLVLLR